MADVAERTNGVAQAVFEGSIRTARALIPSSVAGESRYSGDRAANTGSVGPENKKRTTKAVAGRRTVTLFRKDRSTILWRRYSARNAPIGILVSGLGRSNQMLDVVLKNRNCKRDERRFALWLLERQDDEPASFLVKYESSLHSTSAAGSDDRRCHGSASLVVQGAALAQRNSRVSVRRALRCVRSRLRRTAIIGSDSCFSHGYDTSCNTSRLRPAIFQLQCNQRKHGDLETSLAGWPDRLGSCDGSRGTSNAFNQIDVAPIESAHCHPTTGMSSIRAASDPSLKVCGRTILSGREIFRWRRSIGFIARTFWAINSNDPSNKSSFPSSSFCAAGIRTNVAASVHGKSIYCIPKNVPRPVIIPLRRHYAIDLMKDRRRHIAPMNTQHLSTLRLGACS